MHITYSERVAAEIRAHLARQGMGQADLAAVLGKSQQTASNRWRGVHPFSVDELDLIACHLGIAVESLVAPPDHAVPA